LLLEVVDDESSRTGLVNEETIPMDCNHSTICKFYGAKDSQYIKILTALNELVEEIEGTSNW
jgi:hypothetical protein